MTQDARPKGCGEPAPWWTTVSTRELATSLELVSGLFNLELDITKTNSLALARALAIQQLFVRETMLRDLLAEATERLEAYSRLDATADLNAATAWLEHCAFLEEVCRQAIEMLGRDGAQATKTPFDKFVVHVSTLRRHLIGVTVSNGIGRDIPVPSPATFGRRGPNT